MISLDYFSQTKKGWQRPDLGWVQLNVNGSVANSNTKAAIRGVIRDNNGQRLSGFAVVEINCDNVLLVDTIRNGFAPLSNILEVRLIHEWCNKDWK
ncbi:hypothetical protein Gogos_016885, partial [Gossypium gossypioides]|nr:hypothetical protein [Gossypium gossypioides]